MTGQNHNFSDSAGNSADSDTTAHPIMNDNNDDDNKTRPLTPEEEDARLQEEAAAVRAEMTALEEDTAEHVGTAKETHDDLNDLEAIALGVYDDAIAMNKGLAAEEEGAAATAAKVDEEDKE